MSYSYVVISDDQLDVLKIQTLSENFQGFHLLASAKNYADGLNIVLEHQPDLVFLEIDPRDKKSKLSLSLINEFYRYLKEVPKIIVLAKNTNFAFEAIKHEVFDYLIPPFEINEFRKTILKFEKGKKEIGIEKSESHKATFTALKSKPDDESLTICIKSYGDYRYFKAKDIAYFQADNNSTDIHLNNGEMITAFKTLKHFESILPSQFHRIHNSYIVNRNYISRIHTGNSVCHIKNTTIKIPFSKSYRSIIDDIIAIVSGSDYLEI